MRDYYKRLWRLLRRDFAEATGEQVIGALLVIGILICQIRFGIIKSGEIRANFLSIAWPYALLVAGLFLRHALRTPYELDEERRKKEDELTSEVSKLTERLVPRLSILPAVHEQPVGFRTTYFIDVVNVSKGRTVFGVKVEVVEVNPKLDGWNIPLYIKHDNPTTQGHKREFSLNPGDMQSIDLVTGGGREFFQIVDVIGDADGGRNWTKVFWKDVPSGVCTLLVRATGNDSPDTEARFYVTVDKVRREKRRWFSAGATPARELVRSTR